MQIKFLTAVVAALTFSSAHGAVVKRLTVNPGTVQGPTVSFDINELGIQGLLFQILNKLQNDLATTVVAVNGITSNAQQTFSDKYQQALTAAALVKADADQIVKNVNDAVAKLKPATPTQPSATPSANTGPSPTQTVVATANDIAAKADAVLAQARLLAAAVKFQATALTTQLKGTVDTTSATALKDVTDSVATVFSIVTGALKTISDTAESALTITIGTLQTTQGTAVALIIRITNAKASLNPVLVFSITPDVSV